MKAILVILVLQFAVKFTFANPNTNGNPQIIRLLYDANQIKPVKVWFEKDLRAWLYKTPRLGPIAQNNDGSVRYVNLSQAYRYCLDQGARLPTALEFILSSQSFGSIGLVRDQVYVESPRCPKGSYYARISNFVSSRVIDSIDSICYTNRGYKGDISESCGWLQEAAPC